MKWLRPALQRNLRTVLLVICGLIIVAGLLLYKLGSLVNGLSSTEIAAATQAVGFHGTAHDPLYLPLKIVRSVFFAISPNHGQTMTRLPNALLGAGAILAFTWLVGLWHGRRTAILAGAMFAMSAWVLHVSRLASFDVVYLFAIPVLLLGYALLKKANQRSLVLYKVVAASMLLLYVPGLVWIVLPTLFFERKMLVRAWQLHNKWWQRAIPIATVVVLLPALIYRLATNTTLLKTWLGLPEHFASVSHIGHELLAVPVHLFIRGPQYPELWLGRMPIFDILALTLAIIGFSFYARRFDSPRTQLLLVHLVVGTILIALSGPVSLSLLVPVVYLAVAMGITYLLHEWFRVFPKNPLPRALGVGLISIAVVLSCTLSLRAYYVAWPHNETTPATFRLHR